MKCRTPLSYRNSPTFTNCPPNATYAFDALIDMYVDHELVEKLNPKRLLTFTLRRRRFCFRDPESPGSQCWQLF
jgi:hypothetical protein